MPLAGLARKLQQAGMNALCLFACAACLTVGLPFFAAPAAAASYSSGVYSGGTYNNGTTNGIAALSVNRQSKHSKNNALPSSTSSPLINYYRTHALLVTGVGLTVTAIGLSIWFLPKKRPRTVDLRPGSGVSVYRPQRN